jgi:fission process protein 1
MTKDTTSVINMNIGSSDKEETTDSIDSPIRYTAYANRLRTILLASHRYVAYTSDVGESFRPVAHPKLVTFCYGISWAYLLGDVGYETWKAYLHQEGKYKPGLKPWQPTPLANPVAAMVYDDYDWKVVGLKRAVFQSIASMGLPAFTIHSTVRYSSLLFKNSSNKMLKSYGPVSLGLGIVPFLPYIFDKPVEEGVDWIFAQVFNPVNKLKPI